MKKIFYSSLSYLRRNYLYALTAALCFTIIFCIAYYNIDPDFGWHLKAGEYISKNGIPKYDVFTFTAGNFQWINHEWLNDVLIYMLYNSGGYLATAIFFSFLWVSGLLIAKRTSLKFPLLLATVAVVPFAGIRPVAWTVFFIAILERIICSKNKKFQYLLPIIFIIWANLHGSFVLGLLILILYQLFSSNKVKWHILVISCLSVLINPYGFGIFEEIYRTGADSQLRFRISEWRPVLLPYSSVAFVVISVSLVLALRKEAWKAIFSIPSLALAMTLSSIRHLPIYVITSIRYLEIYQLELISKVNKIKSFAELDRIKYVSIAILYIFIVLSSVLSVRSAIYGAEKYPVLAVSYIKDEGCNGNIFNSYNYGGFLIWKLPNNKVYIDGRMPSWENSGKNYFNEYIEFINNEQSREAQIKKYNIRCTLISRNDLKSSRKSKKSIEQWLYEKGWSLIKSGSDKNHYLFVLNP